MISPSEYVNADSSLPGFPMRLLNDARERKVSRLEFVVLDRPETEPARDEDAVFMPDSMENRQQEQVTDLEHQLRFQAQQHSAQLEAAKAEARMEARREWEEELEERVAIERVQVKYVCEEFGKERARYFTGIEAEVVKLALAIAARILHREARLDPLLLSATVRVALEKVADKSTTTLRVPSVELESWKEVFTTEEKSELQLVGDERLEIGECILETNVGRVELGVSAQLEEIEKGFFDLLQQRPA